jgi:hypothetical protein
MRLDATVTWLTSRVIDQEDELASGAAGSRDVLIGSMTRRGEPVGHVESP